MFVGSFTEQEILDSFAFSRKTLRQIHQHGVVYFKMAQDGRGTPRPQKGTRQTHRGIYLLRNRQKYQLEAESSLESLADSSDVRYLNLH